MGAELNPSVLEALKAFDSPTWASVKLNQTARPSG